MKDAFRQSMSWLHTWTGVVVGAVLFFIFLTGTISYFDAEIDRWMQPERPLHAARGSVEDSLALAVRRLEKVAPHAGEWEIELPAARGTGLSIAYEDTEEQLDAITGEPVHYRSTGGGEALYRMHYQLHYLAPRIACWIVGICAMFMFVSLVTGVIIHKRIFRDFFTFRPGKGQRSWLDAHNTLGIIALPFHLMITYSGLIFFAQTYMPLVMTASYGSGEGSQQTFFDELYGRQPRTLPAGETAPLRPFRQILEQVALHWNPQDARYVRIQYPGDANARILLGRAPTEPSGSVERLLFDGVSGQLLMAEQPTRSAVGATRDVLFGLHRGNFAGPVLRGLYFLSGLMGTTMIATGMVMWARRRNAGHASAGTTSTGVGVVERLNVATIAGLPIAIAAYFWANRIIPAALDARAQWEINSLFIAWALMLLHAHVRPRSRIWLEQLTIAAVLYLLLPVLNAFTTQRHLGVTLLEGEWALAAIDLMFLAVGVAFAGTAIKVHRTMQSAGRAGTTLDDSSFAEVRTS